MGLYTSMILALVALRCSVMAASSDAKDGASWVTTYRDIFGPSEQSDPMTPKQLMDAMNFLHDAIIDLSAIDEQQKAQVDFWYDIIYGPIQIDSDHCRTEYMDTVTERYLQENVEVNVNFQKLYSIFRKKTIELCNTFFVDMPGKMASIVPREVAMNLLQIDSQAYSHDLAEVLRTAVLRSSEFYHSDVNSDEEIFDNWQQQPCEMLMSELEKPEMAKYVNFIDMMIESNDLIQLSPGPIRLWINVVEKCRNLHLLAPTITHHDKFQRQAHEMWLRNFNEMFGRRVSSYVRSSPELKAMMRALHVGLPSIFGDEDKKEVVRLWHEAFTKFDISNCSVSYLEQLLKLYVEHNVKNNANFKQLYMDIKKDAVEQCDKQFSDLHSKLASRVTDKKLLDVLRSDKPGGEVTSASVFFDPILAETLAEPVLRMIENGERGPNIVGRWKTGTCAEIQAILKEPDMRQYSDFVDMSLFGNRENLDKCSEPNQLWARVIDACRHLDNWIPKCAVDKFLAKNVRNTIRTLMMV